MLIIGVDPGKSGALCFMYPGGITLEDIPTVKASKGNRRNYDLRAMKDLLAQRIGGDARPIPRHKLSTTLMVLEVCNPMPRQAVTSLWAQAQGIAYWEALAVGLDVPYTTFLPQQWKKVIPGNRKKDKDGAYWTACNLYPWMRNQLKTPRGRLLDGRCDALCIAEWARREQGGPFTPIQGKDDLEERAEASMHSHHGY